MTGTTGPAALPALEDREFRQLACLIHREAGIHLADTKRALLVGRLGRRLRELGLPSFGAYYRHVLEAGPGELVRLLDAIATNETQFFREPRQFELLGGALCDRWEVEAAAGRRPRALRLWSAACSTGEEPYSLAMLLHARLAPAGWRIEILASDLSTKALARASAGVYRIEKTEPIPTSLRKRYMQRGIGPELGRARMGSIVRGLVRYERINLRDVDWPVRGTFDAVFCRNVLIYFDAVLRVETVRRLLEHVSPGGYLFLGHAESLAATSHQLEVVMPAVYRVPPVVTTA